MNLICVFAIFVGTSTAVAAQEIPNDVDLPSIAGIRGATSEESPFVKSDADAAAELSGLCGGHDADTCKDCGPDAGWCNGSCMWSSSISKCVYKSGKKCSRNVFAPSCAECESLYGKCSDDCRKDTWYPYTCEDA